MTIGKELRRTGCTRGWNALLSLFILGIYTTLPTSLHPITSFFFFALVSNQLLIGLAVSVAMRLCTVDDPSRLSLFFFSQLDVPRSPVLLQPVRLGSARNRDEAFSSNPSKSDLCNATTLLVGQLLDLVNNSSVFIKVFALELGSWNI